MKSSSSEESALTFYTDTVTIKLILTGKIQTIKDSSLRTKKPDWNDRLARNQRRVQPEKPPVTPSSSENEVGPLCVCVCVVCVCVCLFISWNGTPFRCGSLAASFSFQRSRRCQARPPKNRRRRCHRRPTSLSINRAPFPFDRHYFSLSLSLWFSLCECAGRSGSDGRHFHWRSSPWKRIRPIADDLPAQKSRNRSIRVSPMGGNERAHWNGSPLLDHVARRWMAVRSDQRKSICGRSADLPGFWLVGRIYRNRKQVTLSFYQFTVQNKMLYRIESSLLYQLINN